MVIDRDAKREWEMSSYDYPYGFDKEKFETALFTIMEAFDDVKLIEYEMNIGEIPDISHLFIEVVGRDITASQLVISRTDYFIARIVSCFAKVRIRKVNAKDGSRLEEILDLDVTDPIQAEERVMQEAWYERKFPDPRERAVEKMAAIVETMVVPNPEALEEVKKAFIHTMQDTSGKTTDFGRLFDVFAGYLTRLVNEDFTKKRFDIKLAYLYDDYRNKREVRKPSLMEKHLVGRVSRIYRREGLGLNGMLEAARTTRETVRNALLSGALLQNEPIPLVDMVYNDEYGEEIDALGRKIEAALRKLFDFR